jgi:hypothetical protein
MYPPPQHHPPLSVARPDAWKNIVPHLHSHPDAFAYEYIFEDGRLPFLAELQPKNKKDVKTSVTVTIPAHHQVKRNKSRAFEERPFYRVETTISAAPAVEKTSDKLRRAFSLRSSNNNRSATPAPRRQPPPPASIPRKASLQNTAPRSEAPRVPSLVLPTPSPSPEPHSDWSSHSSAKSINFSLPRSSWTSWECGDDDDAERLDMAFLRDTAHGRLEPGPAPPTEPRRDKALALLGISHMPLTPPYTPAGSRAPSVHDYYHHQSRLNSRRTSAEQRPSHHWLAPDEKPLSKALPRPPSADLDRTPRAAPPARQEPSGSTAAQDAPPPRMQLKRKTSKFIEHLDEISAAPPAAPPAMLLSAPTPRRGASTRTPSPRLPPSPSPGLTRSQSLRTPEMRPGPWTGGSPGVVCMAEARPIVAMGMARLVGS